jgi:hypothetical protein
MADLKPKPKTITVTAVKRKDADGNEIKKPSGALAHYKDYDHVVKPKKAVVVSGYDANNASDDDEVQKGHSQITPSKHGNDVPEATPNTKVNKVVHGSALLPNLPTDEELSSHAVIGSYRITKTLGQGTFGKVKEGIHLFTKQKVSLRF